MKVKSFEFNLRELAGSMGDFGTFIPLAVGYIAVCGVDPAGLLIMMGLANIVTGVVYRLPMPIEPMKVLAVVAIAQAWSPSMVYASCFAMGVIWIIMAATNAMTWVERITPKSVVIGIQVALGILLAKEAFKLLSGGWILGIAAVVIILLLRRNRYAPAALVLVVLGVVIMLFKGQFAGVSGPGFSLPAITTFNWKDVWVTLLAAGFAQVPLTATNAVISTSSLIKKYWPERDVTVRQLSLNMGIMDTVTPFFGGMPLCHGAGGLAGQYYFGARTGGTNIMEGTIEIGLGLFFAASIATIFQSFPSAIIGAMLLMVGLELVKFVKDLRWRKDLAPAVVTAAVSVVTNMAYGFLAGLAVYYLTREYFRRRRKCGCDEDNAEHGKNRSNKEGVAKW